MKVRDFVLISFSTLLLLELTFHWSSKFWGLYGKHNPDHFWESRFIEHYVARSNSMDFLSPHVHHPTRGWALEANLNLPTLTTNERGIRSRERFTVDASKPRILILGDSFTFGNGLSDDETWPAQLQSLLPRHQVFNLGVDGYGMDQMLITLKETIEEVRPAFVLCAFVDDDIARNLLSFRDYRKPRFEARGADLVAHNLPIPLPEEVYQELVSGRPFSALAVLRLPQLIYQLLAQGWLSDRRIDDAFRLGGRLVEEMESVSESNGANFTLLHLSYGNSERDNGDIFLEIYGGSHPDAKVFSTRPAFVARGIPLGSGHSSPQEAAVVAGVARSLIP